MEKVLTVSGGFDSGCLPFLFLDRIEEYDFLFFRYNQIYLDFELEKATFLSVKFGKKLIIVDCPLLQHDHSRRNFIFVSKLKELNYSEAVMGNRNIFPLWDHYRDSNYCYLKMIGFLFDIKITLPLFGWSKKRVFDFLNKNKYTNFYNCYKNGDNFRVCDCFNCQEMRKLRDTCFLD